jgi:formylglycine-generating enzyme required for sulfatase activity
MKRWTALVLFLALAIFRPSAAQDQENRGTDKMAHIPAGKFWMGQDNDGSDRAPLHQVHVDEFSIDATEVTVGRFVGFLNQTGDHKTGCDGFPCVKTRQEDPRSEVTLETEVYSYRPDRRDHPVVFVSWFGANAFCRAAGKRLPTEAEWEKAAQGNGLDDPYPWGGKIDRSFAVYDRPDPNSSASPTLPVGSLEKGKSRYGTYEMAGNALEWVDDGYDPECYQHHKSRKPHCGGKPGATRVLRGGSFLNTDYGLTTSKRFHDLPSNMRWSHGFRCAK